MCTNAYSTRHSEHVLHAHQQMMHTTFRLRLRFMMRDFIFLDNARSLFCRFFRFAAVSLASAANFSFCAVSSTSESDAGLCILMRFLGSTFLAGLDPTSLSESEELSGRVERLRLDWDTVRFPVDLLASPPEELWSSSLSGVLSVPLLSSFWYSLSELMLVVLAQDSSSLSSSRRADKPICGFLFEAAAFFFLIDS